MPGILEGIRVLDLTRNVAGPYCTMILGDLGADVIKVERPDGGDDTRDWRPPDWNGYSTTFLGLNRNKRSLAVDLDSPDGVEIVERLAADSDVMVESFKQGSLIKRKLAYADVRAYNRDVVYCSIRGFGARGPYSDRPGYDPIIQAYSGISSITGEPGRPPVRVGPSMVDMGTGLWCVAAIMGGLLQRRATGHGCLIETSLLEVGVAWVGYQLAGYLGTGKVPERAGSAVAMIAPYEAFATMDEYLFVAAPTDRAFVVLCRLLGLDALPGDDRFRTNSDRVARREQLHAHLEDVFKTRRAAEWEELLIAQDIACSRVRTLGQVADDPQVQSLGLLTEFDHPAIPNLRLVDLPLEIDGRRMSARQPPPELGEHTHEILERLGYAEDRIRDLLRTGAVKGTAARHR